MKLFKLLIYIPYVLIFSSATYADDIKVPCRYQDGKLGLTTLESFDCKLANKISSQPQIKEEYKEHVDKKLATYIARQSSDVIEDIALLDSYFDQNGIDLGTNKNVRDSCKLEKIAQAKCGKDVSRAKMQKKLSYILSSDKYLPRDPKDKKIKSLYERMFDKAAQIRKGTKATDLNKCPIEGNSGYFTLNSQFTSADARTLIEFIKKGEKDNALLRKMYTSYPQLKLLFSGKDESLKKKFEDAMSLYSGNGSEKKFVDDFFKDMNTQEAMAKAVSKKCDELEESIEKFVCVDNYPHLGMNEEDRDLLFDGDDEDKIFKEVSRGLSCEMEERKKNSTENDPLTANETIHHKLTLHINQVRDEKTTNEVKLNVGPFCSLYLCEDSIHKKELLSCKNGGPISSQDIIKTCPEGLLQKCEPKVQKYFSYMKSLERDAINSGLAASSMSSVIDETTQKPRGFSSFYQNFLGVEGTLAAEGKKITPITIAEKKAEFVEKKIDIGGGTPSLSQSREVAKVESPRQAIVPSVSDDSSSDAVIAVKENDQFRRTFQPQQFTKTNYELGKDTVGKTKKVKFTDTESSTIDEMRKLRSELSEALGKVKGSEEERLAVVADNNAIAIMPKGATVSPSRNLSSAEKDRLDSYRESLNNWEDRLRTWQNNLSDRDVRVNSGNNAVSEVREPTPSQAADSYNSANSYSNGAKLSKLSNSGSALGGKSEIAGDRAPASESIESEAGVVSSDKLLTLEKSSLKDLGIIDTDSFIIKIRHKEILYSVPVKTFTYSGKSMYVPLLNDRDRELSKIVYESPLFKDYRNYEIERQHKLEKRKVY